MENDDGCHFKFNLKDEIIINDYYSREHLNFECVINIKEIN